MATEIEPDQILDELMRQTAAELRTALGDVPKQRLACCRFFQRGQLAGISTGALVDYLGVSTPSILDMAGYTDEAAEKVMVLIGSLSDREIEDATL